MIYFDVSIRKNEHRTLTNFNSSLQMQGKCLQKYTARNAQVVASLLQACCNLQSSRRYQDAFASLAPAWWYQVCCKLSTDLMQVANCRLDASRELQTCMMRVANCRPDASGELKTFCKLRTADLTQVANCRLAGSWCWHGNKRQSVETWSLVIFVCLQHTCKVMKSKNINGKNVFFFTFYLRYFVLHYKKTKLSSRETIIKV